ncbi:MAG: hypothetical protein CSA52_00535 [Gammaproteobacteria bacterium]|nr:MAG: hypothetical protein CSB48_06505 [Pseudomonadota bacterium]PIE38913.1 MAG: hypothetical protein CSA52_00535 [Gammaproteobacteria bacterium]
MDFINHFIDLFLKSAPWLLLGLFIAGQIKQLIPDSWVKKQLGQGNRIFRAALIGAPLPLCSCGVIPTAMAVRRAGASKASTASFLVATPETGVDSLSVTYSLMGPVMAIARPISAIISAVITGNLVKAFVEETPPTTPETHSSCCGSKSKVELTVMEKFVSGLKYGFGQLLGDFLNWLMVGLIVAALIQAFVSGDWLAQYGSGPLGMMLMVMIAIPMYVCATASTPIAAGLMLGGVSPGAALVFMLAGPATNIATMAVVRQELGNRALAAYLAGVVGSALIMGLALDALASHYGWQLVVSTGAQEHTGMLTVLSGIALALLIIYQYGKKLPDRFKPNRVAS